MELVKAFQDVGENLGKLFAAMLTMLPLNTTEFDKLCNLRQAIESNTMQILAELEWAQEEQKKLQRWRSWVQSAQKAEDANKNYIKKVNRKRWDKEHLRRCKAFKLKTATLHSEADRKELLHHMQDTACPFLVDSDSLDGDGVMYQSVLSNAHEFQFQNHHIMAGAFVKIHAASEPGRATERNVMDLPLPADIKLCDKFDHDTCKVCGHHRKYHSHKNKIWCEEEYSEEVVDPCTKQKYDAAKNCKERRKRLVKEREDKIELSGKRQKTLGADLLTNIQQFEQHGLGGNNAMFVQGHRGLLQRISSNC
eukprot:s765_g17.t1